MVAVAASVALFDDVAGCSEVGDDPVGGPLGDIEGIGEIAQAGVGVVGDLQHRPGMVSQEAPVTHGPTIVDLFQKHFATVPSGTGRR